MNHDAVRAITHASAFFAPILLPLLVWILFYDREIKSAALQALLFHIAIGILLTISGVLSLLLIGIPFLLFFTIVGLYYPIKGIIYSLKGKPFRYPIIGSLVN